MNADLWADTVRTMMGELAMLSEEMCSVRVLSTWFSNTETVLLLTEAALHCESELSGFEKDMGKAEADVGLRVWRLRFLRLSEPPFNYERMS